MFLVKLCTRAFASIIELLAAVDFDLAKIAFGARTPIFVTGSDMVSDGKRRGGERGG